MVRSDVILFDPVAVVAESTGCDLSIRVGGDRHVPIVVAQCLHPVPRSQSGAMCRQGNSLVCRAFAGGETHDDKDNQALPPESTAVRTHDQLLNLPHCPLDK